MHLSNGPTFDRAPLQIKALNLRRGICQLLQEFVLDKLTVHIFPEIEKRLNLLDLYGPILRKVRTFVYDMLEDITRSTIYDQIATAYGKLQVTLTVPGCEVLVEKISKRASAEDEL